MSVTEELKALADAYAKRKISRRALWQGAAALGLSSMWIAALERGATAAPAPTWRELRARGQADKATTLIIAVAENVDTFDPGFTVGSKTAQTVLQNTFDQLTQYEIVEKQAPDGTPYRTVNTENIIPMLCESWKLDGADMVFTMRDGVTYHNGDPIDANTMVTGYQRIFETKAVSSFLLSMGGAITDSSAFSAPDPKTFVIKMSKPNMLIPKCNVMHNTSVLNPNEMKEHATADDPWALDYFKNNLGIGNGPYKLESYKPDDSLVLVAADNYYGEKPPFQRVILKIVADATQRVQLLKNGDVDFATKIPVKEFEGMKADPNIKVLSIPSTLVTMLEMNNTIPPFDKKEVRQAVAYATPYQAIIDQIYLGQAQIGKSLVPNGMPTSDFSTNKYELNYDKAKELLAAAGYPDGKGLPEIKLTVRSDDVQWERIAIIMQDSLKKIGMNVTIEKLAYAQFNELEQGKKLQMWTDEWISWVNDPYYHMSWLAHSKSPTNYPLFSNPRVDEIIDQFTLSDDVAGREAASKEAQAIIIEECPYVFLCQPNWIVYMRNDLDGYVYYNDELPRYYHFRRAGA
jgi:peptide/nickel transport system substrate-binding protein